MMSYLARAAVLFLALNNAILSSAQLCTGSLGDPVVNINFGTGNDPDLSYTPPGAYAYVSSTCPNDGFFTVVNATQGCFGNTWHTVSADHTGGGAFMLVNASYDPGDFFRTTVTDLCPNTTYEFAAWVMNVLRSGGIHPDLTFRVEKQDGTVLGLFSTGPVATASSPQWLQYGFFFTTPPDNPVVVLRITNNAPGGIGNDLALDDITFRPCGPSVTAIIQGNNGVINLCENENTRFIFSADPSTYYLSPAIQWQQSIDSGSAWTDIPGAVSVTFTREPTSSGHYWYRFSVTESGAPVKCRIHSNFLVVNVWPLPLADAGPDRVLIYGDTLVLQAVAETGATYNWQPAQYLSDVSLLQPSAFPTVRTSYKLSVLTSKGCYNEDWVTVKVVDRIYIPTAFTPNNDGKNDQWRIPFLDPEWGVAVWIYDRYGQLVYQGEGSALSWDGKKNGMPQNAGVYIYQLKVWSTGQLLKGTLMLIR